MIGVILSFAMIGAAVQDPGGAAVAAIEIQDSVNVGAVQTLRLRESEGIAALGMTVITEADEPALIQISGDAGRLYRIQVAENGVASGADDLRIWSANTGDISSSLTSTTDASGRDLLRIDGKLAASSTPALRRTLAVKIHYE